MGKKLLFIFFLIPFLSLGQCFTCAKNIGGWTGESVADFKQSVDGMYLLVNNYHMQPGGINKYDSNCNLLWHKTVDEFELSVNKMASDDQGNIYVLITWQSNSDGNVHILNGLPIQEGLNLIKFDTNGNFIWNRFLGLGIDYGMRDVYVHNSTVYVTSTFVESVTISNQTTFSFLYNGSEKAYVAKFDFAGNLLDAQQYGTGYENYTASAIDNNGNIYLSSYERYYAHSDLRKINSNLQLDWHVEVSNNGGDPNQSLYKSNYLHYNPLNDKLYMWGLFYGNVNVQGNIFTAPSQWERRSILAEFNTQNGALERIKKIDNVSYNWGGVVYAIPTAYMAEKNNDLYVYTGFKNTLPLTNSNVTSVLSNNGYNEDLVLFKIDLANFDSSLVLKSFSDPNAVYSPTTDIAGPMFFRNNSLYLSSTFQSVPLTINGTAIGNNSGNGAADVMFYRYDLNSQNNSGNIEVAHTCLNDLTDFNIQGSFDSIAWNFGDPASANNSAVINNPQHLFSGTGTYNVTATVTCGTNTQIVNKVVQITAQPLINTISPITECETIPGSGICSSFNTSTINSQLSGSQSNVTIEFRDVNGNSLPNPLPNPYTNRTIGGDTINARMFFTNNPTCYSQTNLVFNASPRSVSPTMAASQKFCIQQNATIGDIAITGQNTKWYDALTGGNLIAASTLLQDGITYYASQTVGASCESPRVPVSIQIQNTAAPTGTNQSFCVVQNATLGDVIVTGTGIKWYATAIATTELPATTLLADNTTYYATQTLNGCESVTRLPISITLIFTLNASNYVASICDNGNNGTENVVLSDYDSLLLNPATGNTFTYYSSSTGAENQIPAEQLSVNHVLALGLNSIYVRIESPNGCHQVVELLLTLVKEPVISIPDELPLCENKSIRVNAGAGFDTYNWSTGAITSSIVITQPGNYSVTVTQNHGSVVCTVVKNFTVVISYIPVITSIDIQDWTDTQNSITINTNVGDFEYSIDGENFQASNVFNGLPNGEYTVTVRDRKGCGIATKVVYLLNYPKFFTPNGDGYNDSWYIKFSGIEPHLSVKIFDRYGKLLNSMNTSESWDGTYIGKLMPADDYWFFVTREDGRIHKGHFALKR